MSLRTGLHVPVQHIEARLQLVQDEVARDLLRGLLQPDPTRRMGLETVLAHPFFAAPPAIGPPIVTEEDMLAEGADAAVYTAMLGCESL